MVGLLHATSGQGPTTTPARPVHGAPPRIGGNIPEFPAGAPADPFQEPSVLPRSGDVLHVTRAASVQFLKPITFRVIRVHDWPTYDGWVWLDGYELNATGDAVSRRSIFVQAAGLRQLQAAPQPRQHTARPRHPVARKPIRVG